MDMEKSTDIFEVTVAGQFRGKLVSVRSEETTDGIPIYHCDVAGTAVTQLRQETSGEWTQLWGDLPADTVARLGEAIAAHN